MATYEGFPDVWGYIDDYGSSAHDASNPNYACYTKKHTSSGHYSKVFFSFDTSEIPGGATISDGSLDVAIFEITEEDGSNIGVYLLQFHIGHDALGAAIDTGDWNACTYNAGTEFWVGSPPSLPTTITHDVPNPDANINKGGDTDFCIRDDSAWTDSTFGPEWEMRKARKGGPTTLDATYTVGVAGLVNRFNWKNPAKVGFSAILAAVIAPSGELVVRHRFYPTTIGEA